MFPRHLAFSQYLALTWQRPTAISHERNRSMAIPTMASNGPPKSRRRRMIRPRVSTHGGEGFEDPWSAEELGFILVGVIVGPHGLHGEMKVRADTDFGRERLGAGAVDADRFLQRPGRRYPRPVSITSGRKATQNDTWIVKVEYVENPEEVDMLRGGRIFVKQGDRPRMGGGEFTAYEIAGMRVGLVDSPEVIIGTVRSVITREEICAASGGGKPAAAVAADLIEIALYDEHGNQPSDDPPSSLVPFVKQIVPLVDLEAGLVLIDPPAGLLEITRVNNKRKPTPPRGLLTAAAE